MPLTTDFVERQEEQKRAAAHRSARRAQDRRMMWLTVLIVLLLMLAVLAMLGVSVQAVFIVVGIVLIAAGVLDRIENRRPS